MKRALIIAVLAMFAGTLVGCAANADDADGPEKPPPANAKMHAPMSTTPNAGGPSAGSK